jgi:hypothetical protein
MRRRLFFALFVVALLALALVGAVLQVTRAATR